MRREQVALARGPTATAGSASRSATILARWWSASFCRCDMLREPTGAVPGGRESSEPSSASRASAASASAGSADALWDAVLGRFCFARGTPRASARCCCAAAGRSAPQRARPQ